MKRPAGRNFPLEGKNYVRLKSRTGRAEPAVEIKNLQAIHTQDFSRIETSLMNVNFVSLRELCSRSPRPLRFKIFGVWVRIVVTRAGFSPKQNFRYNQTLHPQLSLFRALSSAG